MDDRYERATEAVGDWLSIEIGGSRPLSDAELRDKRYRRFSRGWRFPVAFADKVREIDVLLDRRFPWIAPRVALVGDPHFRKWPHVESDECLCLLPSSTEVDPDNPVDIVRGLIRDATQLIEDNVAGKLENDFRDEFRSYWPHDVGVGQAISLIDPVGPSRLIAVRDNNRSVVFAEDGEQLHRWLSNFNNAGKPTGQEIEDGALIWLRQALVPSEYPTTAASLISVCETYAPDSAQIVEKLAGKLPASFSVLIGADTANGPALAAVKINKPGSIVRGRSARIDPTTRGFRPGKMPEKIAAQMMLGGTRVTRMGVNRADPDWIHGRGADPDQPLLRSKTVTMIGCGSVGGAVARLLAQSGIGGFFLIDPETLEWANIGRHTLGAQYVGENKAKGLAKELVGAYPHILSAVSKPVKWHTLVEDGDLSPLLEPDLIVSTVGSWGVEGGFNAWHRQQECRSPVIYGWTEPHACAGHAVAIHPPDGCFACGLGRFGEPKRAVTHWNDEAKHLQEPACGAVYQPYGPIGLSQVNALVAGLAVDVLIGRVVNSGHRVWSCPKGTLETAGGTYTEVWCETADNLESGGITDLPWPRSSQCTTCRQETSR